MERLLQSFSDKFCARRFLCEKYYSPGYYPVSRKFRWMTNNIYVINIKWEAKKWKTENGWHSRIKDKGYNSARDPCNNNFLIMHCVYVIILSTRMREKIKEKSILIEKKNYCTIKMLRKIILPRTIISYYYFNSFRYEFNRKYLFICIQIIFNHLTVN